MIKRILLALVVLPILALLIGVLSWNSWIFPLTQRVLAAYEIELVTAEIGRPTLDGLTVENVLLHYTSAGYRAAIDSPKIVVGYQPVELIAGRLAAITADEIQLKLDETAPAKTDGGSASEPPLVMPAQLFQQLPVDYINLERIQVDSPVAPPLSSLAGTFRLADGALRLELSSAQSAGLNFIAGADRNNNLNVRLLLAGNEVLSAHGHLEDQDFQGTLQADLALLTELMDRFALIPPDYRLAGDARLDWTVPTISPDGEPLVASRLSAAGTISINAALDFPQHVQSGAINLHGRMRVSRDSIALTIDQATGKGKVELPAVVKTQLPALSKDVQFEIGLRQPADLEYRLDTAGFITGELMPWIAISRADTGLVARAEFTRLNVRQSDKLDFSAAFTTRAQINTLTLGELTIQQPLISTRGRITGTDEFASIELAPAGNLKATRIALQELVMDKPGLSLINPLTIELSAQQINLSQTEFELDSAALSYAGERIGYSRVSAMLEKAQYLVEQDRLLAQTVLDVKALELNWQDYRLTPLNLSSRITLNDDRITGDFSLSDINKLLKTEGEFAYSPSQEQGSLATHTTSIIFNKKTPFLPRIVQPAVKPIDFIGGSVTAAGSLTIDKDQIETEAEISLQNIDGFYATNLFFGLNGKVKLQDLLGEPKISSDNLQITKVNVGTPITNIRFNLKPLKKGLEIGNFSADIFGGKVTQEQIVYDWDHDENYVVLNLHGIQLSELLKLQSGISGQGTLGGVIPLIISDKGVSIHRGGVSAQAPGGVIRYKADVPLNRTAANAGLQMTLDALKNFHFTSLSTEIEYDYQGDMLLKASLQGRNPDLKETRPFHFNLNITENIPTLLKALRLSQDISEDLNKRISDFYSTNPRKTMQ